MYGYRLLVAARNVSGLETSLIVTRAAETVLKQEAGIGRSEVEELADHVYDEMDFMAPVASGSFRLDGTVVAPCSMKTLAGIAVAYEENLVIRAGSVALKERRPLILLTRETPLSPIHLKNMLSVAEAGGIIMPPLPPLYFKTGSLQELVDLTVGRILGMLGIDTPLKREWGSKSNTGGKDKRNR